MKKCYLLPQTQTLEVTANQVICVSMAVGGGMTVGIERTGVQDIQFANN